MDALSTPTTEPRELGKFFTFVTRTAPVSGGKDGDKGGMRRGCGFERFYSTQASFLPLTVSPRAAIRCQRSQRSQLPQRCLEASARVEGA